jgi:cellulose biosynthesis protein BcsQ
VSLAGKPRRNDLKTMAALLLSQVIADKGEPVMCIDTDPVNASFSNLSSLPSDRVSIFNGNKVDTKALDVFSERLLTEDAHFVIDNGASSFVPVSHYLRRSLPAVLPIPVRRKALN